MPGFSSHKSLHRLYVGKKRNRQALPGVCQVIIIVNCEQENSKGYLHMVPEGSLQDGLKSYLFPTETKRKLVMIECLKLWTYEFGKSQGR